MAILFATTRIDAACIVGGSCKRRAAEAELEDAEERATPEAAKRLILDLRRPP